MAQIPIELYQMSDRALLIRMNNLLNQQGVTLSAITDAVAASNAALAKLQTDIAAEIAQVAAALANNGDVQAALDGLSSITSGLTADSTQLEADDPAAPVV